MRVSRSVLDRDAVVVGDATVPNYRASRCMDFYEPNTYLGPNSWAGLGYGFPAGLGAKVGLPHKQVVVITGDGGFQYNIQELGTALQYGISPVVLVFNDNAWGVLKGVQKGHLQWTLHRHRPTQPRLRQAGRGLRRPRHPRPQPRRTHNHPRRRPKRRHHPPSRSRNARRLRRLPLTPQMMTF